MNPSHPHARYARYARQAVAEERDAPGAGAATGAAAGGID